MRNAKQWGSREGEPQARSARWRVLAGLSLAAGLAASCALLGTTAAAESVSLSATRDTSPFEGLDNNSNGAGGDLFAGMTGPLADLQLRRALLGFDVAEVLPAGASVESAFLTIWANRRGLGSSATDFTLHRVTTEWGEGSSIASDGLGAPATLGDATWAFSHLVPARGTSTPWSTPGGDFEAAASGGQTIDGLESHASSGPGLVQDVQLWLDSPEEDFGWILLGDENAQRTAARFDSREGGTPPSLLIEYVSEPTAAASSAAVLLALSFLRRRRARR